MDHTMREIGIWGVGSDKPRRFQIGNVEYEKHLEEWIERDPSLVRSDLLIVGRQVHLDAGILDLLAIDQLGRWAVLELKRGNVRRETVAQAVDYAAAIAEMQPSQLAHIVEDYLVRHGIKLQNFLKQYGFDRTIFDDRTVIVYVIGTGRDQNLDRLTKNLAFQGHPINVVNFEVFENEQGERLILRQLSELSSPSTSTKAVSQPAVTSQQTELDRLFALADQNGIGPLFVQVYEAAMKHGLYPRTYKWSIMFTPPQNKTRVLICTWVKPKRGHLDVYVETTAFAEFFPISERDARRILGQPGRYAMTFDDVNELAASLDIFFAHIAANS